MRALKIKAVLNGVGRLFDFSQSYNSELREKYLNTDSNTLDKEALQSDWIAVGKSLRNALDNYKKTDSCSVR
jgi:hypothetical protein